MATWRRWPHSSDSPCSSGGSRPHHSPSARRRAGGRSSRPWRGGSRPGPLLGRIVVTLGLALAINGLVVLVWGADTKVFPFPLSDVRVYRLGGVVISQLSLGLTTAGLVLVALLYLLVPRPRVGRAMRAEI